MHWLDGISLDDNLISGRASGSNGENSDINQRKSTQNSPNKSKRRRHAHYKLNTRLDRKSSRGMIYENEELRLRTININAEVERGQSDIKRLRRENEDLRREIWKLHDKNDRLYKRFKAKLGEYEYGGCRGSGGSSCPNRHCSGGAGRGSGGCEANSDDSDSCDTCRGDDGHCSDECCQESECVAGSSSDCLPVKQSLPACNEAGGATATAAGKAANAESQNVHFDHLSVVSEETLSNSELAAQQNDHLLVYARDLNGSQSTLPSLMGPITPLTPLELVANQLNDLQATVPPLSYFENVLQQHMHSNMGSTPETSNSSSTGKTVRHTNGWDYNLQSPFTQRKYSNNSSPARSPGASIQSPPTLSTFVPTPTVPLNMPKIELNMPPATTNVPVSTPTTVQAQPAISKSTSVGQIETVAITTNATQSLNNSPKHFFAPIKPRLKLNTTLANRSLEPDMAEPATAHQHCEPPDIYVNNGLASPYQRQLLPTNPQQQQHQHQQCTPSLPQRLSSPQVSPRHRRCQQHQRLHLQPQSQQQHKYQHQQHQCQQHQQHQCQQQQQQSQQQLQMLQQPHCMQHLQQRLQEQQQIQQRRELHKTVVNVAATVGLGYGGVGSVVDLYSAALASAACTSAAAKNSFLSTSAPELMPLPQQQQQLPQPPHALQPYFVEQSNHLYTKPCEPIYATAQKRCNNTCISATALTKPLMTATTNTTKTTLATLAAAATLVARNASTAPPTPTKQLHKKTTFNKANQMQTATNSEPSILTTTTTTRQIYLDIGRTTSSRTVDSESQTDSVNLEAILNDIETISTDILAIQLEKNRSRDNLSSPETNCLNDATKKPYRSEMNLYLNYDGSNPSITPATPTSTPVQAATQTTTTTNTTTTQPTIKTANDSITSRMEREHTDSPSPHIPDPMAPFPEKCSYIGFDQLNQAATAQQKQQRPPLPPGQVVATVAGPKPIVPPKCAPPAPPARAFAPGTAMSIRAIAGSAEQLPATSGTPPIHGLTPNKSHLYKAIASAAAAKRAVFRSAPSHLTRSLDVDYNRADAAEREALVAGGGDNEANDLSDAAGKRRERRVSIVCGEEVSLGQTPLGTPTQNVNANMNAPSTTASCVDVSAAAVMANPSLKNLKQTSQSTPSSPHSSRRLTEGTNVAAPTSSVPHHHHHQQQHSNSSASAAVALAATHHRKDSSGDQTTTPMATATVSRTKCSRRHSEGTVHRISNASAAGGSHHHHHNHHHQHSSSLVSNNPHHSHHSHQDSNQETIGSCSDRNSNSFASSRESSTSFSLRSNRRKISISSHTGGKIPWCGCWGNGCC